MKRSTFFILANMRTCQGLECFGKFFIGNNAKFAYSLFRQLKGQSAVNENSVLSLELMEEEQGLPVNLQIISCSLEDLACNCKTIAKEVFRFFNLEEM